MWCSGPFVPSPHSLYSASAQLSAPTCQCSGCSENGFCFLFIKIILFIYVFVFDSAGSSLLWRLFSNCGNWCLLSSCGAWTSHCRGFSCCRARGFRARRLQYLRHMGSVIVASGLSSTDSVVLAHGLSCSTTCGIFLDQGLNLCLLHWQADSLLLSHQGSLGFTFSLTCLCFENSFP